MFNIFLDTMILSSVLLTILSHNNLPAVRQMILVSTVLTGYKNLTSCIVIGCLYYM